MLKPLYKTLKLLSGRGSGHLIDINKNAVYGTKTLMCEIKSQQSSASASAQPISEVHFALMKLDEQNINLWQDICRAFEANEAGYPRNQMYTGYIAFRECLKLYSDFKEDWWIAYASSINHRSQPDISNIEMLMCVATQEDSIISTHIGIFRNTTTFYKSDKHKNLSTMLHAFAGYAINKVYSIKKQYMITKPTPLMNYIIKKYYDDNVIPGQLIIGTNRNIKNRMITFKDGLLFVIEKFVPGVQQIVDYEYDRMSRRFTVRDIYSLLNVVCKSGGSTILEDSKFKTFFEAYHLMLQNTFYRGEFIKLCDKVQRFFYTFNIFIGINPNIGNDVDWCKAKSQIIEDDFSFTVKNNREYIIKPSWFSRHMHLKDHNDWLYMRLESCPEIWLGMIYCSLCDTINYTSSICITCNNPLKIYTKRLLEQQLHTPLVPIASTATE